MPKVIILGITEAGLDSLIPAAQQHLQQATFIAGGLRHLSFCNGLPAEKFILKSNLTELMARLNEELAKPEGRAVVLASGDPLFYGIGKYLGEKLGRDKVQVLPTVSSLQQGFAKLGLNWEDAVLTSVHGRSFDALAPLRTATKAGIFTDGMNHPGLVAAQLLRLGWADDSTLWVLEDLDGPAEKVRSFTLIDLAGHTDTKDFNELNVVIALRAAQPSAASLHAFGLPDEAFAQRKPEKGLITKAEVRALSLSKMRVFPGSTVWDIGAATGSVSIEAARLGAKRVWALEKNAEDCDNVRENVERFHTPQVRVLQGTAPDAFSEIPVAEDPDSVFVGGTAGRMDAILDACLARLKPGGSLVLNAVTLENQADAIAWFGKSPLDWGFLQIQVSRGKAIKTPTESLHRLDALNPVQIFWGYRRTDA